MKSLSIFLLCFLMGCNSNQEKVQEDISAKSLSPDYQMEIYDPAIAELFLDVLKKEGVYFEVIGKNTIELKLKDRKKIDELFLELERNDLPVGRSISLQMPGLEDMVIQELQKKRVSYSRKKRQGDFWIVWSAEDSAEVEKIIEQSRDKARRQLIENYEKGLEQ